MSTDAATSLDRPTYRAARQRLAAAQKSSKGAPAYSRYVNRPIGRSLAAAAFVLHRTPNQVTAVSAAFSAVGILVTALVRPTVASGAVVAVALVVGYAFDAADGQLARLRGGGSPAGEWLDHMVDAAKISALHLAVLISAYRFLSLDARWLLVPIGYCLVAAVTFFGMILNDLLRQRHAAATGAPVQRGESSTLRSILVIPTDYGFLCLVFLLLGAPSLFFGAYTLFFAANAGFLVLAVMKWFGDMDELGTRTT